MFNEVLYLTMTKEIDCKNFPKIADLTVEGVKLKYAESPKSCEENTETINRYQEKKRWLRHILRHDCELRIMFEKNMKDV